MEYSDGIEHMSNKVNGNKQKIKEKVYIFR